MIFFNKLRAFCLKPLIKDYSKKKINYLFSEQTDFRTTHNHLFNQSYFENIITSTKNDEYQQYLVANSDITQKIIDNFNMIQTDSIISMIEVLTSLNLYENVFRDKIIQKVTQLLRQKEVIINDQRELLLIMKYFVAKTEAKSYCDEFQQVFSLNDYQQFFGFTQLQELSTIFIQNNKGSQAFFRIIQNYFLEIYQEQNEGTKQINLLFEFMQTFCDSGMIIDPLNQLFVGEIEHLFSNSHFNDYIQKYMQTAIYPLSLYFGLNYEQTVHLHQRYVQLLKNFYAQDGFIDSKKSLIGVNYFKILYQIKNKSIPNTQAEIKKLDLIIPQLQIEFLRSSITQREVTQAVKSIFQKDQRKIFPQQMIHSIYVDIFIEPNIIIELNSRYHFISGRRNGLNQLKYQILQESNYKIIEIHINEWRNIAGNQEMVTKYLLKKFKQNEIEIQN